MLSQSKEHSRPGIVRWLIAGVALSAAGLAAVTRDSWQPLFAQSDRAEQQGPTVDDEHDHGHHAPTASIRLSEKALQNIGFEPLVVEPSDYHRTLSLPAIVAERPGRSQLHIAAPLTGVVTEIYSVQGEAVAPGEKLFELHLTHEELVSAQRDYLGTTARLDIVNRELSRLRALGEGVIAGRRVIEQEYEKQKLEVALLAAEQAMLLHGFSEDQLSSIRESHKLVHSVFVRAPEHVAKYNTRQDSHRFTLQRLSVSQGEQVSVGQKLAVLADHCELHVEGIAFEDDALAIRSAALAGSEVTARLLISEPEESLVRGLEVLYISDQIEAESRALKVYLGLPNKVARESTLPDGKKFLEWIYKPGQRMQLNIPVETWRRQLVLPVEAVVEEGAEKYVYQQNGESYQQVAVRELHRDPRYVVLANDGALFPGDVVAGAGAYQMHLALKNQSGGAVDPHAGHSH